MRNVIRAVGALLLLGTPIALSAQATDSLPFRPGQWGAEFSATGSFASAGLLRFTSARSAWLLDAGASFDTQDRPGDAQDSDFSSLRIRVGKRWYRALGPRVAQFASIGPVASYERSNYPTPTNPGGTYEGEARVLAAGVFGELGAGWFVTPQLSLGAVWGGAVSYTRRTADVVVLQGEETQKITWWHAQMGSVALRVNLYF